MLPPGPHGYVPPSGRPYFPRQCEISPYENRSSGYRSHAEVRCSAPSLQNLTGKPFLTCSVGPFMVELFTAGRLNRSPRWSAPVHSVARGQLPTPAALNELAEASPDPTDGICTRFACCICHNREAALSRDFTDTASFRVLLAKEVFPHRPLFPSFDCHRAPLDRTPGLLRRRTLLPHKGSVSSIEFTPTSLH